MQLNPRLLANLLVILVNLLAKLTRVNPAGGHGGSPLPSSSAGGRGIHSGEARTSDQHQIVLREDYQPLARL